MKIKFDKYDLGIVVNSLMVHRIHYDNDTNERIDRLLLRLIDEYESMKRRRKIPFQHDEICFIRKCLIDWRNAKIQEGNDIAVEVIEEILLKFIA